MSGKEKPTPNATPTAKPKIIGGRGKMNGKETGVCFTPENQPTSEARSKGQIKRFRGQELARLMLNMRYLPVDGDNGIREIVANVMAIDPNEVTLEQVMLFRQAQKAMTAQDTQAFNAVIDRAFGKPKEYHEVLEVEVKSDEAIHAAKMKKIRENFDNGKF